MRLEHAHKEAINSVCYLNQQSSSIILTAGDDSVIKLWDKRALTSNNRPSGAFFGHVEGVTHIASKGDDKFIASNGKD